LGKYQVSSERAEAAAPCWAPFPFVSAVAEPRDAVDEVVVGLVRAPVAGVGMVDEQEHDR
jgi:hypothetical protein